MSSNHPNQVVAPDTPTSALSLVSLFGVKGRTALITGGGSGLGSYAAIGLALHGCKVYIVGRRKEKLEEVVKDFQDRQKGEGVETTGKDGKIVAIPGDVSSKDGIKAVADAYGKYESHLDVLINGAGILRPPQVKVDKDDGEAVAKALWEEEWANFSDSFNVNVIGVHFMTMAMVPYLAKAKKPSHEEPGAVVINIASIAGIHVSRGASISYQTSKDAVIKLSTILSGRLKPLLIRVNSIEPGVFPSEMTNAPSRAAFEDPKHPFHEAMKGNPIKRNGTVEDWVGLILMLSSRAGGYINGAGIVIDGGRVLSQSAA